MIESFTDIFLIALAGMWTGMIILMQMDYLFRRFSVYLPFETEGKILNALTHFILIISIWASVLHIFGNPNIIWILLGMSLIPFGLWLWISRIQRKYMKEKINRLRQELMKGKAELEKAVKRYGLK